MQTTVSRGQAQAQGTIEYLVIIAVVVVIGLVVVGLLIGMTGSGAGVSKSSSKIGGSVQVIGIIESLLSPTDRNYVVKLLNNSGNIITVSNVKIGDTNASFSEDLTQSGSKFFKVPNSVSCDAGKIISQDVVITYVTVNGLTKIMVYPSKVMFDCSDYVITQANLANQCPGLTSLCSGVAVDANVRSGVTYCSSSGSSTGSLATQYLNPNSTTVSAGYYDANNLATIDSDLVGSNILSSANIFGVTGSVATQTLSASSTHGNAGYYAAFDLNTIDSDLNVDNVKSGVNVFGVNGTFASTYDGNATSSKVLSGYSFFGNSSTKQNGSLWIGSYLHSKQNRCWNTANTEVACVSADGNTVYQDAKLDGNVANFTDLGDQTVRDNFTGLIWQKAGTSTTTSWYNALGYCAQLNLGGYPVGSWRLPSDIELMTFKDNNCSAASTNCTVKYININFTQTGWDSVVYGYWSSTTVPSNPTRAYYLHSYYGSIDCDNESNGSSYGARCVRSGK